MTILIAVALAAAAAAPPALADLSTIDCVMNGTDADLRAQIDKEVTRNFDETGKRPTYDPAIGEGLRKTAATCAAEHGWSAPATRSAVVYSLARLALPVAQRVMAAKGFDAAELEDRFQALPEEVRSRPLTSTEIQGLVIASVTDEARQTRENAELLNEYFLFLSTIQYAAHDFSQA